MASFQNIDVEFALARIDTPLDDVSQDSADAILPFLKQG